MDKTNPEEDDVLLKVKDKRLAKLYKFAENDTKYTAVYRPFVGGLFFGIGGAALVMGAVFGWVFHLLDPKTEIILFWAMLSAALMIYIGIGWTS